VFLRQFWTRGGGEDQMLRVAAARQWRVRTGHQLGFLFRRPWIHFIRPFKTIRALFSVVYMV
jgi:hypothetical protein